MTPIEDSISPSSIILRSGDFTLTVNGTNFVTSSIVNWNGSPRATTFISSTQLTAAILAADIITAGTVPITISNSSSSGGAISENLSFVISPVPVDLAAGRFIFANVSSGAVVGDGVTFNIEAVNASGTIDTTFEQGVTLTVGGSGNGGGLVTIINGVGTSTVSDNIAEAVTLGFDDSQLTGLNVSSTANILFVPDVTAKVVLNHPGDMNVGTRLGYIMSREDRFGNFVSNDNTVAYLYSNSTSSNASFWNASTGGTQISSTSISRGSTSATFWYYDDTSGSRTVTVSDNSFSPDGAVGIIDASDSLMVAPGAVKFIFANTPLSATAGSAATTSVYAVDSLNNVDASFEGGVTVSVSGSATGGGLINLVNGVGVITVNDSTAETVTLGLRDTQNNGLGATATTQIVFNAAPVIASPSSGSQPVFGIKPGIDLTFSGRAYPGASIIVIRKDLGLQAIPVTEATLVASDGSFVVGLKNVTRLSGQTYLLSFVDRNGLVAQTKAYNIPVQDKLVYGNILAAPTIGFSNSSVISKGMPLVIKGYATPKATVELFVDGNPAGTIVVNDASGKYSYPLSTDALGLGRHAVWAIQKHTENAVQVTGYTNSLSKDELFLDSATNGTLFTKNDAGGYSFIPAGSSGIGTGNLPVTVGQSYIKQAESDFSNQQSFTVSPLQNPKLDLNGDGIVDVRDLSIFLSYLKSLTANLTSFHIVDSNIVKTLDFNGDGVVDVKDLNILGAAILHQ